MALDTAPSSQVLDLLFDGDNGVLSKEFDLDGKGQIETLNFGDLDLLSGDLLDLIPQGHTAEDVFDDFNLQPQTDVTAKKRKVHSDHDYFAHLSPGQHSDSGVSLNSVEQDDSYLPSMAATDDSKSRPSYSTSPQPSMSPLSDTNSDSNPLGLEDFDFSTCMDFGEGDLGLDTVNTDALSSSKDNDVSIDFDFSKGSEFSTHSVTSQQHVQTIKTSSGQQAIILVDANTRQPIKIHSIVSRTSSDSDSLPFTMKDVDADLSYGGDNGRFPELRLTDEEKELLAREGVTLPTNMPLTKEEERVLKSVRRKIRNKISAKESRKRKQGYVENLELRVKKCTQENQQLHKKVESLSKENTSLITQLNRLKAMVSGSSKGHAQASTCVMVLLLSFALLVIPNISPFSSDIINPLAKEGGIKGNSRSLLGKDEPPIAKVSMFTEKEDHDSDPYGVSSKPEMPWGGQNPATYSAKSQVPVNEVNNIEDNFAPKVRKSVINMEVNETENVNGDSSVNKPNEDNSLDDLKGEHFADKSQSNVQFEAETASQEFQPPPEKRARTKFVDDYDL